MTQKPDGGPAYPADDLSDIHGMSLRDAVALAALPAVMAQMNEDIQHLGSPTFPKNVCSHAFKIADAFIAARNGVQDT